MAIDRPDGNRRIRILARGGAGRAVVTRRPNLPPPGTPARHRPGFPVSPPEARFKGPGEVEVLVKFQREAFASLLAHCAESNEHGREICGLLLGRLELEKNPFQKYLLVVTDVLPLESSDASGAHVSAAPEVWAWADAQIEERFQGKERLGWYHTHPTQGVFFSGADKDFHSIFTRPFQFALVVDPRTRKVGLFHWQDRSAGLIAGPIELDFETEPAGRPAFREQTLPEARGRHPRLLFLVLGLAGFVSLLASGRNAGRLAPMAILIAVLFTVALLLRLWNSGASDLREERHSSGPVPGDRLQLGPALTVALGALLLPFFVGGIYLGLPLPTRCAEFLQAFRKPSASPTSPPQESMVTPIRSSEGGGAQEARTEAIAPAEESPPPVVLQRIVSVWERQSPPTIVFLWADPDGQNRRVDYNLDTQGNNPSVTPSDEEALLSYLLGVAKPGVEDLRRLQKAMGIDTPDGDWRSQSRETLIRTALARAGSRRDLKVESEEQLVSIIFKKQEGDV